MKDREIKVPPSQPDAVKKVDKKSQEKSKLVSKSKSESNKSDVKKVAREESWRLEKEE